MHQPGAHTADADQVEALQDRDDGRVPFRSHPEAGPQGAPRPLSALRPQADQGPGKVLRTQLEEEQHEDRVGHLPPREAPSP